MRKNIPLLFLILVYNGIGQVSYTTEDGASYQFDNVTSGSTIRVSGNSGNKVKGSEFLEENWQQATVFDKNAKKKFKLLARFNAYTREIEILKEKDIISLTPINGITVELANKTFAPFKPKESAKFIFAEELVNGKISLFKVYDIKIIKAASDSNLLGIDSEDRLTIVDNLYFRKKDGEGLELPSKKKSFEELFNERTLNFLKKERLSSKKEEDIIRIFEFQNENGE